MPSALYIGDRGVAVRTLQVWLTALGFLHERDAAADGQGRLGHATALAMGGFLSSRGLPSPGDETAPIVDDTGWSALVASVADHTPPVPPLAPNAWPVQQDADTQESFFDALVERFRELGFPVESHADIPPASRLLNALDRGVDVMSAPTGTPLFASLDGALPRGTERGAPRQPNRPIFRTTWGKFLGASWRGVLFDPEPGTEPMWWTTHDTHALLENVGQALVEHGVHEPIRVVHLAPRLGGRSVGYLDLADTGRAALLRCVSEANAAHPFELVVRTLAARHSLYRLRTTDQALFDELSSDAELARYVILDRQSDRTPEEAVLEPRPREGPRLRSLLGRTSELAAQLSANPELLYQLPISDLASAIAGASNLSADTIGTILQEALETDVGVGSELLDTLAKQGGFAALVDTFARQDGSLLERLRAFPLPPGLFADAAAFDRVARVTGLLMRADQALRSLVDDLTSASRILEGGSGTSDSNEPGFAAHAGLAARMNASLQALVEVSEGLWRADVSPPLARLDAWRIGAVDRLDALVLSLDGWEPVEAGLRKLISDPRQLAILAALSLVVGPFAGAINGFLSSKTEAKGITLPKEPLDILASKVPAVQGAADWVKMLARLPSLLIEPVFPRIVGWVLGYHALIEVAA